MKAVVAVVACAWLVSKRSEAQTGKGLSQADVSKIKEVSQIHVKAALPKDWTMYVDTFLESGVMYAPHIQLRSSGRGVVEVVVSDLAVEQPDEADRLAPSR